MTVRALIADDQAVVRSGFRVMLSAGEEIEVVGEASDGASAVELAARRRPDVVVMDIRMPGMDGIEATRRIVAGTSARVLAVTTYDLDEYVFGALRAGAAGFLLKTAEPEELRAAVVAVAAGEGVVAAPALRRLIERFAQLAPVTEAASTVDELTDREHEVLLLLARGLSNAQVAAALTIEATTVKRHVSSLLAKLGLSSRAQAIVFSFQRGLITPGELAEPPRAPLHPKS